MSNFGTIVKRLPKEIHLDFLMVFMVFFFNYSRRGWDYIYWTGAALSIISFYLWALSRLQLGKNFSVLPRAKGLVTTGLYSKIRNPVYVFSTLVMLGAVLPSKSIFQYSVILVLILVQIFRAKKEDRVLEAKFKDEYRRYKAGTWF